MKKRALIYTLGGQYFQENCQLEAAKELQEEGYEIMYLVCDGCLGGCMDNRKFNRIYCKFCSYYTSKRAKSLLNKGTSVIKISTYMSDDIENIEKEINFDFDNLDDVKNISYKNIQIGYGAASTFISITRDIDPDFIKYPSKKNFIIKLLKEQIRITEIVQRVIDEFKPDLIVFHNGRFSHYKPLYGLACSNSIDFICTESSYTNNGKNAYRMFYRNSIPHDPKAFGEQVERIWNKYDDKTEREIDGKSFFDKRRNGIYSGDKIYTSGQKKGMMPVGWNEDVENIVIFNSSEDEFRAVNKEYDESIPFGTQFEAIREIVNHYKDDSSKHFTLRIHPNLKMVNYSYHTDLLKLSFPNLTIIPADSDISSYALMDASDKIIVFGSTMGVEGNYWRKPTINIGMGIYDALHTSHQPKTIPEIWSMIENKDLQPLPKENSLKLGVFFISKKHDVFKYSIPDIKGIKIGKHYFGKSIDSKIFSSHKLYVFIDLLVHYSSDIFYKKNKI